MAGNLREATLYRETGTTNKNGANRLTRGKKVRPPQTDLRKKRIDVHTGHFWVQNLPDLTKWNEAFLELTVVAIKGKIRVAYPFKLEVKVKDKSFSADIQGVEVITFAEVIGNGLEFQCRLTERDKINKDKFGKLKDFVDQNDIPGVAQTLLKAQGLPFDPKEAVKLLFNTVELIDEFNDDDRVWIERPKLDLRSSTSNPLYEGWYAFVTSPKSGKTALPLNLYEVGGALYEEYESDEVNVPFRNQTYLTWQLIADQL